MAIQLTLEQQGFGLCGPFIRIYFSVVNTTVLRGQWLLTPRMGRNLGYTGPTINHNHTRMNPYLVQKERKVKLLGRVWLCNLTDYSLPGSSIHGIFQARILEWVAITFSRGSSQPRDWTWISCTALTLPSDLQGSTVFQHVSLFKWVFLLNTKIQKLSNVFGV